MGRTVMSPRLVRLFVGLLWLTTGSPANPVQGGDDTNKMPVPERSAVARLVFPRKLLEGNDRGVKDAKTIGRLVAFLMARNNGWDKVFFTPPAPQFTVLLEDRNGKCLFCVYIGTNWLGARPGGGDARDDRYRKLPKKDREQLMDILGLKEADKDQSFPGLKHREPNGRGNR